MRDWQPFFPPTPPPPSRRNETRVESLRKAGAMFMSSKDPQCITRLKRPERPGLSASHLPPTPLFICSQGFYHLTPDR